MLEALRASERDVWLLADRVLTYEQQAQVHEYIRAWQVQNPTGFPPGGATSVRPTPRSSSLFLHWQATF